jgi:hypothetical protein
MGASPRSRARPRCSATAPRSVAHPRLVAEIPVVEVDDLVTVIGHGAAT